MKTLFIFAASFFVLAACSTSKNTAVTDGIQLKTAWYQNWSGVSLGGSENADRGTDITLSFSEWPEEYDPESVIFRNRESFPVTKEMKDGETVLKARIVHNSEVLTEVSESVFLSDRLTFTLPNGEVSYLEIEDWEKLPDEYF